MSECKRMNNKKKYENNLVPNWKLNLVKNSKFPKVQAYPDIGYGKPVPVHQHEGHQQLSKKTLHQYLHNQPIR